MKRTRRRKNGVAILEAVFIGLWAASGAAASGYRPSGNPTLSYGRPSQDATAPQWSPTGFTPSPFTKPDGGKPPVIPADGTNGVKSFSRMTGPVAVNYFGDGMRSDADSTDLISLFTAPGVPTLLWPGRYGAMASVRLPIDKYLALKFTVPADYFDGAPLDLYGLYSLGESEISSRVSMSISLAPGDFGQLGTTVCGASGMGADYSLAWFGPTHPASGRTSCRLQSGQTYYLNVINADTTALESDPRAKAHPTSDWTPYSRKLCGDTCTDPILNGYGSWPEFKPPVLADGSGGGSDPNSSGTQTKNALVCVWGTLQPGHIDFFSPMPPSCSQQGKQAGQSCSSTAQNCPL